MRAGPGAAAMAVVALPEPGRVADRVLQRAVLREPALLLPGADPRAGVVGARRPRRLAGAGAGDLPPLGRRPVAAHQPDRGEGDRRGDPPAVRRRAEVRRGVPPRPPPPGGGPQPPTAPRHPGPAPPRP